VKGGKKKEKKKTKETEVCGLVWFLWGGWLGVVGGLKSKIQTSGRTKREKKDVSTAQQKNKQTFLAPEQGGGGGQIRD